MSAELASRSRSFAAGAPAEPQATEYVARFILETRYSDIPASVIELARKSILDGLGLALAGS
ncbi:MAG TPA: MmgE/PrpD family protein, partial [Terriglobia bacterium]|nr:MmgE/PrpD family protein [Terriglobia bacterium]